MSFGLLMVDGDSSTPDSLPVVSNRHVIRSRSTLTRCIRCASSSSLLLLMLLPLETIADDDDDDVFEPTPNELICTFLK